MTAYLREREEKAGLSRAVFDGSTPNTLPPPENWQEVAHAGRELWAKHADLLDAVDLDTEGAFTQALLQVLEREGVETGAKALVKGDQAKKFNEIIERLPATWVDKANTAGVVYIRNLDTRGFQTYLDEGNARWLNENGKKHKDLKIFAKFFGNLKEGDSLLKLNNMGGEAISAKAQDIAIHEYTHRLQRVMPDLDAYFRQLWLDRTQGEETRPMADFAPDKNSRHYHRSEVGREDNFAIGYIGRNYGDDDNPRPLEVMTMTFQTLLGSGVSEVLSLKKFLERDSEMLHLGIGLLARFKP